MFEDSDLQFETNYQDLKFVLPTAVNLEAKKQKNQDEERISLALAGGEVYQFCMGIRFNSTCGNPMCLAVDHMIIANLNDQEVARFVSMMAPEI